jgi:hypothetical protein
MHSDRIQRRIDALLDEADQAVGRSEWALVRDRAQNVCLSHGRGPDAWRAIHITSVNKRGLAWPANRST